MKMIDIKRQMANIEIELSICPTSGLLIDECPPHISSMAAKINQYLQLKGTSEHIDTCNIIRDELEKRLGG